MIHIKIIATDARRAFQCWDEQNFKAHFNVILNVPDGFMALSNTEIIKTENGQEKGTTDVYFATTPKMSTYLLAFCVGNYDFIEEIFEIKKCITFFINKIFEIKKGNDKVWS